MKHNNKIVIAFVAIFSLLVLSSFVTFYSGQQSQQEQTEVSSLGTLLSQNSQNTAQTQQTTEPTPTQQQIQLAETKQQAEVLVPDHYFQTFNNCGPASLAMALSHFGIERTQAELGNELRPYQVASGDNDDKSVTLEELAAKAEELGLVAYYRPAGDLELLKQLISNGFPVITRTWTQVDEDIGHYRVVKGYDDSRQVIIQDDSLQGKDLAFSYSDFNTMWEKFGYEYLVLGLAEDQQTIEAILGSLVHRDVAWQEAKQIFESQLEADPDDIYAKFNLSVALYQLGEYEASVETFEAVEDQLPPRTLWYQIEPLLAYQKLGRYSEVLPKIENVLANGNRAFSELYQIRGEIYLDQGNTQAAIKEFELAVQYNKNYEPAQVMLENLR